MNVSERHLNITVGGVQRERKKRKGPQERGADKRAGEWLRGLSDVRLHHLM